MANAGVSVCDAALRLLDRAARYFNTYAFAHVAIYDKPFTGAAKDTWRLLRQTGVDALINDNLVGGVLQLGSLLVATATALVCGAWAKGASPRWPGRPAWISTSSCARWASTSPRRPRTTI